MRTPEEIVAKCKDESDVFGFGADALLPYLTFEQARPLLKEDAKADEWPSKLLTRDNVIDDMREYMEFAWGKVRDHRGLSAGRSVQKMESWIWLLGDDDVLAQVKQAPYKNYGAPKLKLVCERYGFPMPADESAIRMANALPCYEGCEEGCGR